MLTNQNFSGFCVTQNFMLQNFTASYRVAYPVTKNVSEGPTDGQTDGRTDMARSRVPWPLKKAGYTATPVACGWAGAIFEVSKSFRQERYSQNPYKRRKSKV